MKTFGLLCVVLVAACASNPRLVIGDSCSSNQLFITTTDFATTGEVALFNFETGDTDLSATALNDQDTVAARLDCVPVLIEHGLGNILVQSATDPFDTVSTISVDAEGAVDPYATNPQAVISASATKAYVLSANVNDVIVINPEAGTVETRIALSSFLDPDDTDGSVDMLDGVIVGEELYVALGNYWFDDAFAQHLEGSVLVAINTVTDEVIDLDDSTDGVQGIELAADNPWRGLRLDNASGRLWVASTGAYGSRDGQIESVDLSTGESDTIVDENALGGELGRFVVVSATHGFVMVDMDVKEFDPSTGDVGDAVTTSGLVSDIAFVGDLLFVWGADGLRKYDAATGDEMGGPWTFGAHSISSAVAIP